jgi:hypothetical protein
LNTSVTGNFSCWLCEVSSASGASASRGERLLGEIPQIRPKRRQLARENAALTFIREIEQNFATAAQSMTKSFREASHRIDHGDQ